MDNVIDLSPARHYAHHPSSHKDTEIAKKSAAEMVSHLRGLVAPYENRLVIAAPAGIQVFQTARDANHADKTRGSSADYSDSTD